MHESVKNYLVKWWQSHREERDTWRIADLGSLNLNGQVRDYVPVTVGIDIVEGPGVDVVVLPLPLWTPPELCCSHDAVTAVSSFQFCAARVNFKRQVVELLKPGGLLFLTMCNNRCTTEHSTSDNPYGWGDEFRMGAQELLEFWQTEIAMTQFTVDLHNLVLEGYKV